MTAVSLSTYTVILWNFLAIGEIAKKFHINDSSVFKHIRRHSIPTRQIGNYVYVPKSEIDKLYKSL